MTEYRQNVEYTFTGAFGVSRTGNTVVFSVLDNDGTVRATGSVVGATVEVGSGVYGDTITLTELFNGYIKIENTTISVSLFIPINIVLDSVLAIDDMRKETLNRWLISSNQLVVFEDDKTTPFRTYDLFKLGNPNDGTDADERNPV